MFETCGYVCCLKRLALTRGAALDKDGIFEPLEDVGGVRPGQICTVLSDEELGEILETIGWLKAAEKSFELWNNPDDAVYDTL